MKYREKSDDSCASRLRFYVFKLALTRSVPSLDEFLNFDLDQEDALIFVELYTTEYQQFEKDHVLPYFDNKLKNDELYISMKALEDKHKDLFATFKGAYFEKVFPEKMSKEEFKCLEHAKQCGYCEITLEEINKLASAHKLYKKNERGFSLELDRKYPNKEYSFENCIMACYWCNNAKTDEFTAEEFVPIGKAIGTALKNRLLT